MIVAPGAVALERRDPARAERAAERARRRAELEQDQIAAHIIRTGEAPARPESRLVVERWSRRSRARMTRALCELDYSVMLGPGAVPAMVTLTYPGDWLTVAPTGAACKRHLRMFQRQYRRAWGARPVGVWKLELQRRGAPHFHILMVPPRGRSHDRGRGAGLPFREWLSVTWAGIVDHPDPIQYLNHLGAGTGIDLAEGLRAKDPKRIAVYYTKHGAYSAKEYQNVVPDEWRQPGCGPGRFWGYWGLHRLTRAAEIGPQPAAWVARLMRRHSRAQGVTREVRAPRTRGGRPVAVGWDVRGLAGAQMLERDRHTGTRRVRRRVERVRYGAGWLSVNDGPRFAADIARYLATIFDEWSDHDA